MKKELVEFIRAKYSLGAECDEAAIKAHLATVGTTVEAMQSEMDAKKQAAGRRQSRSGQTRAGSGDSSRQSFRHDQ